MAHLQFIPGVRVLCLSACFGALAACAGDPKAAVMDAALDPEQPGLPSIVCSGEPPVMKFVDTDTNTEIDPDWSCYSAQSAAYPMPTSSPRSVNFSLANSVPALVGSVAGVTVDLFFGPSTLGRPAATQVLDAAGGPIVLQVPAGTSTVSSYVHALMRDNPQLTIANLRQYDLAIPAAGETIQGGSLLTSMQTLAANLALGGQAPDPDKALMLSYARDCQGRDVVGAQFELIDNATKKPIETGTTPGAPRYSYSQFALPTTQCTFTSYGRAEWLMVNAPVNVAGDAKVRSFSLRLKGRMRVSDLTPITLGEREVELFPGTVTSVLLYRLSAQ